MGMCMEIEVTIDDKIHRGNCVVKESPRGQKSVVVNYEGMPTVATVCNDDVSDRDLAANDPDAAFLNADNYAQFAWRSLAQGGG